MPIYEYQCQSCHKISEHIQKINDPLLTECESCHGKLEKLVSSTSFQLKGTGWYVTDFKNSDKKTTDDKKPAETASSDKKPTETTPPATDDKKSAPETKSASTEKEPVKTKSSETKSGEA